MTAETEQSKIERFMNKPDLAGQQNPASDRLASSARSKAELAAVRPASRALMLGMSRFLPEWHSSKAACVRSQPKISNN
jgi:hypothetical protein